jgi:hypothetical protein
LLSRDDTSSRIKAGFSNFLFIRGILANKTTATSTNAGEAFGLCPYGQSCFESCELLTPKELAAQLKVSLSHLANERWKGAGIPFIKVKGSVRYLRCSFVKYLTENTVNTSN